MESVFDTNLSVSGTAAEIKLIFEVLLPIKNTTEKNLQNRLIQ